MRSSDSAREQAETSMATTDDETYVVRGSNHSHELLQITFRNVWKYAIFGPLLHLAMRSGNKVYLLILRVCVCVCWIWKQIFNWFYQMEMNWMCRWVMLWASIHQCDYQCKWQVWNARKLPTQHLCFSSCGKGNALAGTCLNGLSASVAYKMENAVMFME